MGPILPLELSLTTPPRHSIAHAGLMRRGSSRNDDSASSSGPGSISDRDSFRDRDFMSSPRSEYQGQGRRLFSGIFPTQEEEKDRERDRDKDRPGAAFDLVLMDSRYKTPHHVT